MKYHKSSNYGKHLFLLQLNIKGKILELLKSRGLNERFGEVGLRSCGGSLLGWSKGLRSSVEGPCAAEL